MVTGKLQAISGAFAYRQAFPPPAGGFLWLWILVAASFAELGAAEPPPPPGEDSPLPVSSPAWLAGYRIRYPLRVAGDPSASESGTVLARLPTGGWLQTNAADIVVQDCSGQPLATAVLAHDPGGHTIVQFKRHGNDRWYWAYALPTRPRPAPGPGPQQARAAAAVANAQQVKMAALKVCAGKADDLRKLEDEIARAQGVVSNAAAEIAQWDKLAPGRRAAAGAAESKIGPAREAADKAGALAAAARARADEKVAAFQQLTEASALKAAGEAALPARLAAAQAATAKAEADKRLADLVAAAGKAAAAVNEGAAARAAAEELKNKASRTIAALTAGLPPAREAYQAALAAAEEPIAAARRAVEAHRDLMAATDPTVLQEGLTVEFRQWSGDELVDWAIVVAGLQKSENILFNAVVPEVRQNVNPARRSDPRNFAASYRGFLRIATPGVYRFFVNGDDAAFLFIDGYKVYSRRGSNPPLTGRIAVFSVGEDMELEAGVHPFEIHQVVGNTPGASGQCAFMWLPPGSRNWALVPRSAFAASLLAVPAAIEEAGGGQVAGFQFGMDDTLSSDGVTLHLVRFEAQGNLPQPERLVWDFGDGSRAAGRSVTHVYFREGDYEVSLQSLDSLPPFRRRVHVWTAPVPTRPGSLARAVEIFSGLDLARLAPPQLHAMFAFLLTCEQPARWPLMERLGRRLLSQPDLDLESRAYISAALMEAVARQGRAAESLALLAPALAAVPRLPGLQVMLQRQAAKIEWRDLKDFKAADRRYAQIIAENRRRCYPALRLAANERGDMFLEAGDQARAGEAYRLAAALGGAGRAGEKAGDAATRGALLRIAEQQLKAGNVSQGRRLLERIEHEFPEQKLEGLYRFLRAEADRSAGRYAEAIRNYEVLLQLRQWTGYRAPALYGIADSCYRNGEYSQALAWLKGLQESFPDYFAAQGLTNYQALVGGLLKRQQELGGQPGMARAMFQEYASGFEPGEGADQPVLTGFRRLPSLGLDGASTAFSAGLPRPAAACAFEAPLHDLGAESEFWVEFWYRDTLGSLAAYPAAKLDCRGADGQPGGETTLPLEPTFGEWRKAAARLKAPGTRDARVKVALDNHLGLYEFDGLRIQPISAWQAEALRAYLEGSNPP